MIRDVRGDSAYLEKTAKRQQTEQRRWFFCHLLVENIKKKKWQKSLKETRRDVKGDSECKRNSKKTINWAVTLVPLRLSDLEVCQVRNG